MCGLIGVAATESVTDRDWFLVGRDAMSHRGPDDAGEWWSDDGKVGLGHRRLSILDLSQDGHQPMSDEVHGLSIIFNGEIYNHNVLREKLISKGYVFRSHSDTEVLLAAYVAWGKNCLTHLSGMFAFALYDARKQRVFLARDRVGEKPLFYRLADGELHFASELKALMINPFTPRNIDAVALDCYLAMGFVPGERCILQGYNKLPPAHAMSFDLSDGALTIWKYWSLPELSASAVTGMVDEDTLLNELEILLEEAVGQQLVADVPVGILLSGGLDSSLVTAMAVRRSQKVRTFSIGFPNQGKLDETHHAQLIAHHFGTKHTVLTAEPTTAGLIPILAKQFDEPMVDSSMIPMWLVSNLVREHCTVALGGDGGDELFGGYPHYRRLLWMHKRLASLPGFAKRGLACIAEHVLPVGMMGRNYIQSMGGDLRYHLPLQICGLFDATSRYKLMRGYLSYQTVAEDIHCKRTPHHVDLLQRATRMDFYGYLAEDILVKVDRTSMLNSLEVRAPFLNHKLIEFAFCRVPSNLKTTVSDKKILLKRLANRVLPPEFEKQRKQGFSIPLAEWLKKGPFRELFWDTLTATDCLFDRSTVQSLLKGQDRGFNNGERLFALVQFELWRRYYSVTI